MKKVVWFAALIFAMAVFFVPVYAQYSHIVRVGLLRDFANRDSIAIANTEIQVGVAAPEGFLPLFELVSAGGFTVRNGGGRIEVLSGGSVAHAFPAGEPGKIMDAYGAPVRLGDHTYRGVIEFIPTGGTVSAVNVISIEEYLFGVLPAEMAAHFHPEALKAQAVAARTYTLRQIRVSEIHRDHPFDICDTTCCQVYHGSRNEDTAINEAVFMTYGLMLFYGDEPISANYFSSSGGATENSEDVWVEFRPYLRAVHEIAEHNPLEWDRTFTWAQLTTAAAHHGAAIGTVNGVSISRIADSGRVLQLTIHGIGGTWVVPPSVGVRGFFAPIGGSLPSRNFRINGAEHTTPAVTASNGLQPFTAPLNTFTAQNATGAIFRPQHAYIYDGTTTRHIPSTPSTATGGSGITITGAGWGHGVGMSQMGAEGMARAGHTFMEILHHYYTNVEIRWY